MFTFRQQNEYSRKLIKLNFIVGLTIYTITVLVLKITMTKPYQSKLVLEGPILISTTAIKGDEVMSYLRNKIVEAIEKGYIENAESTRVLILSGSHGDGDSGHSGLTDIEKLKDPNDEFNGSITNQFYEGDCVRVGLKPIKPRLDIQKLPISEDTIPDAAYTPIKYIF